MEGKYERIFAVYFSLIIKLNYIVSLRYYFFKDEYFAVNKRIVKFTKFTSLENYHIYTNAEKNSNFCCLNIWSPKRTNIDYSIAQYHVLICNNN